MDRIPLGERQRHSWLRLFVRVFAPGLSPSVLISTGELRPHEPAKRLYSRIAKHDEGVYRFHALAGRQHHQRVDVQFRQAAFEVHGEM